MKQLKELNDDPRAQADNNHMGSTSRCSNKPSFSLLCNNTVRSQLCLFVLVSLPFKRNIMIEQSDRAKRADH